MKRFFRRKKKKIIRALIILIFLALIALLVYYVLPKSGIKTLQFTSNKPSENSDEVEVKIIDESTVTTSLPEYITTVGDTSSEMINEAKKNPDTGDNVVTSVMGANGKAYTAYVDNSEKYFITILSNDNTKLTIMLSNRTKPLLAKKSPIKIGVDYNVSGLKEKIVGVYDFEYSNYKYPILLLLSSSGKLYYVDIEASLKTGKFKSQGPIQKVSNIYKICNVTVNDGKRKYKSAVLTDVDGIGYEFTLDMIGK